MPPQLEVIHNQNTGEDKLYNPETQSLFDVKDYPVVTNQKSGKQALFDSVSQSILAFLPDPSQVERIDTGGLPATPQEHPVEYAKPRTFGTRLGDLFRSSLAEPRCG